MKEIKLTRNLFTQVDDEDFELLSKLKWNAKKGRNTFYAARHDYRPGIFDGTIFLHRLLLKVPKGFFIDHIDNNGLNNQKSNLRLCTPSQNGFNVKKYKTNTSGYKGIVSIKSGRWSARISINNKRINLGNFNTKEEAYKSYCEAAKKYRGEFANF